MKQVSLLSLKTGDLNNIISLLALIRKCGFLKQQSVASIYAAIMFLDLSFTDVIKSGIGFLIWFAGLTAWIVVYQKYRASWGEIGDRISFVIPLGQP